MVESVSDIAPGAAELLALKDEYLMPCVYHFYRRPPRIVAGEGCYLIDDEGRGYLDAYTGVGTMSAGHSNPAILEPAIEQLRRLQHTTSIYLTEPALRLAEALAQITPGALRRSFLCASGSEAVEGALLLAALHTGRRRIIAMDQSLHGRTRWAMNATGLGMWRTDPFPIDGVDHVPFGDVDALRDQLEARSGEVAAVIGEPIQGNGGVRVPPPNYWSSVRSLCDEHGALLVLDEVQTGMGRTGRWFASEHESVVPDVMALSKALGNGFPIAAFITTDAIAASYTRPGASTYGGNPVAATAALATITFHRDHRLAEAAAHRGDELRDGLARLTERHHCFDPPCGQGLMLGLPVRGPEGEPDASRCNALVEALKDHGLLVGKTGADRNVLTFMPPLLITTEQIGEILHALDEVAD